MESGDEPDVGGNPLALVKQGLLKISNPFRWYILRMYRLMYHEGALPAR